MPVDKQMLDPMLDPFRNMAKECEDAGHSGPDMDEMMTALNRMEELGQEMDDFINYSAQMTSENLQMNFSNAYSKVLASAVKSEQGGAEDYDDAALLKQTVDALKDAVKRLKEGKEEAKKEAVNSNKKIDQSQDYIDANVNEIETLIKNQPIIEAIENLIEYGESGVNYPTFLRVQMEKGLDKAMEGTAVTRGGLAYTLGWANSSMVNPFEMKRREEELQVFNELAEKSKFGVPDSLQVSLAHQKIEHKYVPDIAKWDAIKYAWDRILSAMETWCYAHMSFADQIFPWNASQDPRAAIKETKDTSPGIIKERIRIFKENYGLEFMDIFSHKTFIWDVEKHFISQSQEWMEFLIKTVYPQCKPMQLLNQETVTEVERKYKGHLIGNPEWKKPHLRNVEYYDSIFGEGMFEKKMPPSNDDPITNAAPWDLSTFIIE